MTKNAANPPKILVVDDEEAIRVAVGDILELAEIDTILAANGQEAIQVFEEKREEIQAIILDLRMPVLSGAETFQKLRELDPNINIILSSGYDDKVSNLNFDDDPAVFFLRKPYAMDTLIERVHNALGL